MNRNLISRRLVLQSGGAAGLAAALGLSSAVAADAAPAGNTAGAHGTKIVDLGPAVVQFSLMSSILVGDTVYIGSRNLDPVSIIALHLPTNTVTAKTSLGTGYSIQALAADPSGRYLYAGTLQKSAAVNLYRWDLQTSGSAAEAIGQIGDRDVRDLAVAPDGRVYAVGGGGPSAPALWEYDPATGKVRSLGIPDAKATGAQAVAATGTTVFVGAGSVLNATEGTSRASLYAYDKAKGSFTSVLPPEMEASPSIRELTVIDGKLAVGTTGSTEPSKVGILDLADLSSYSVATSMGKTAKKFASLDGQIYFASDTGLMAYSIANNAVTAVEHDGPDLGEIWGIDNRDGRIAVTSAYGFVAEIDPLTHISTVTDLIQAGAPAGPQTAMGVAAGAGYVYVGGTGTIARHTLRSRDVVNLRVPGEAKDAVVVRHVLYTGQYSSQGIWKYDPRTGKPAHQAADFPSAQNRPLDVAWDEKNKLVLAGAQCDTEGGGSFWTYDPRSGKTKCFVNPVNDEQLIQALAIREGVAFLGGGHATTQGPGGIIVAFDPAAGRELWRIDPEQTSGTAALSVRGRHLYGMSRTGGFFVIDIPKRALVHKADLRSMAYGYAAMVTNRGAVYAVSRTNLFRFDPKTFEATVVVPNINGAWYSEAHLANDENGYLYTLRDRNLVQIDDHPRH